MKGPSRTPLSKKVAKKAVVNPVSQQVKSTGIVGDVRPHAGTATNLQRAQWGITNRQSVGDWKES
jgi:ABC-type lipopolysaccharide export system ATPase subunit